MKWLAVWEGTVTGSIGGRDDGYPETKFEVFDNDEQLADFSIGSADFYRLIPADDGEVREAVSKELAKRVTKLKNKNFKRQKALDKLTVEEKQLLGLE